MAGAYPQGLAERIVSEARRWIGTPYVHQGRMQGRSVDCIGLIVKVAEALPELWTVPDWRHYRRRPDGTDLMARVREYSEPYAQFASALEPGAIAVMRWPHDAQPSHFGIYTERGTIVHAHGHVGRCTEHRMNAQWRSYVVCCTRFRLAEVTA